MNYPKVAKNIKRLYQDLESDIERAKSYLEKPGIDKVYWADYVDYHQAYLYMFCNLQLIGDPFDLVCDADKTFDQLMIMEAQLAEIKTPKFIIIHAWTVNMVDKMALAYELGQMETPGQADNTFYINARDGDEDGA